MLGIRGFIGVHEDTSNETAKELIEAIDEYLLDCEEYGRTPIPTDPEVVRELESYFENDSRGGPAILPADKELAPAH